MKKNIVKRVLSIALMLATFLVGCSQQPAAPAAPAFDLKKEITVVARDSASGTRGAFHELMKIKVKEGDKEVDKLVVGALEFDGQDKVITAVEGNKYAIGYVSLGALSNRIKAAKVDGVEATINNVKNGTYKVSRPFLVVTKGTESAIVKDFIAFTASKQAQDIISKKSYITVVDNAVEYKNTGMKGTIKIAGSTSVSPVMQLLIEAYNKINPDVKIEMQANGSSQGIKAAMDGSYDIGMSSRDLKADEAATLNKHVLAMDGIAVILNNANEINSLTSENITAIYLGQKAVWSEVK